MRPLQKTTRNLCLPHPLGERACTVKLRAHPVQVVRHKLCINNLLKCCCQQPLRPRGRSPHNWCSLHAARQQLATTKAAVAPALLCMQLASSLAQRRWRAARPTRCMRLGSYCPPRAHGGCQPGAMHAAGSQTGKAAAGSMLHACVSPAADRDICRMAAGAGPSHMYSACSCHVCKLAAGSVIFCSARRAPGGADAKLGQLQSRPALPSCAHRRHTWFTFECKSAPQKSEKAGTC